MSTATRQRLAGAPLTQAQSIALDVLCERLSLDAEAGSRRAYGVAVAELTEPEAAALLVTLRGKWNRRFPALPSAAASQVRDTPRTPAARATGTDGHGAIADPQLAAAVDWLMDDLAAASSSLGLTPEHCRAEFEAAVALRVAGGMAYEDAVRREWAALREVVEVRA